MSSSESGFLTERLRAIVIKNGADICGFAHVSRFEGTAREYHPLTIWNGCRTVAVWGLALPEGLYHIRPNLIYGHFNDLSIRKTDEIGLFSAREIERAVGIRAVPLPCDAPYEYWDSEKMEGRGLVSVKQAAVLAGIGTIGKSRLLLNGTYGNRLTLGLMLIDLDLESDPMCETLCLVGCRLCITHCPAGAISVDGVDQKKCRTHTYRSTGRGFPTVECCTCRTVCPVRNGAAKP